MFETQLEMTRGNTPTFRFVMNVPVGSLGEPRCVIRQEEFIAYLETEIDVEDNALLCTLSRKDSILLVGGFSAWIQVSWVDSAGNVIAFPMEEIHINDAYIPIPEELDDMEELLSEPEEQEEQPSEEEEILDEEDLMNDDMDNDTFEDEAYEITEPDEEGL